MRKQLCLAVVGGFVLVSAHPPGHQPPGPSVEARSGYPPCSRTVTDRCIQLYERGVRTQANLARNAAPAAAPARAADDDIDVAYAGNVLQARPSGAHPPAHPMPHHPAPHAGPHHPMPRAGAHHSMPGHAQAGASAHPHRRAHAVQVAEVAPAAGARAYPVCGAGVTDRCRQQRHARPHRQYSMRVRRAGERG